MERCGKRPHYPITHPPQHQGQTRRALGTVDIHTLWPLLGMPWSHPRPTPVPAKCSKLPSASPPLPARWLTPPPLLYDFCSSHNFLHPTPSDGFGGRGCLYRPHFVDEETKSQARKWLRFETRALGCRSSTPPGPHPALPAGRGPGGDRDFLCCSGWKPRTRCPNAKLPAIQV